MIYQTCVISEKKINVIYNPAATGVKRPTKEKIEIFASELWRKDSNYKLLAVGSLKQQKGFDILINAYNLFPNEIKKNSQLIILGEGPERKILRIRLINSTSKIIFHFLGLILTHTLGFSLQTYLFFRQDGRALEMLSSRH